MNKTTMLQFRHGLEACNWEWTQEMQDFQAEKHEGAITSLICEECNGAGKNFKNAKMNRKYRRPETSAQQ